MTPGRRTRANVERMSGRAEQTVGRFTGNGRLVRHGRYDRVKGCLRGRAAAAESSVQNLTER